MNSQNLKRIGTIDFLSFVFCFVLILTDFAKKYTVKGFGHFTFFAEGNIGADFFLITAGALMAASAARHQTGTLAQRTIAFMKPRLRRILPYHTLAFVVTLALWIYFKEERLFEDMLEQIVKRVPGLFFIQNSGLPEKEMLAPEWWLAGMMWGMLIFYPLLLQFGRYFSKLAAPLLTVLMIGYISFKTGMLNSLDTFLYNNLVSVAFVRSFGGICGGIFAYEAARHLQSLQLSKVDRVLISLVELTAYVLPLLYACSDFEPYFEPYAFYSLLIGVTLSFSHQSVWANLMDNRLTHWLGKAALPLFYCHLMTLMTYKVPFMKGRRLSVKLLYLLAVTAVFAGITQIIRQITKKKSEVTDTPTKG